MEYDFALENSNSEDSSYHPPSSNKKTVRKNTVKRKKKPEQDSVHRCDSCDKTFTQSQSLNRHLRQAHQYEKLKPGKSPRQYSEKELELFKTFELPKPLNEYVSKPRNLELLKSKVKGRMNDADDKKKHLPCGLQRKQAHVIMIASIGRGKTKQT